jgi:hypothetical protein
MDAVFCAFEAELATYVPYLDVSLKAKNGKNMSRRPMLLFY